MAKVSHPHASTIGLVLVRIFLGGFFLFSAYGMLQSPQHFIANLSWATAGNGLFVVGNVWPAYGAFLAHTVHGNAHLVGWMVIVGQLIVGLFLLLGFLTRLAAGLGFIMATLFLLATMHLAGARGGIDIAFIMLGLNGGFMAMTMACLVAGAGRTFGIDAFLMRTTGAKILW